ncbi:hypothetical protein [Taibaiella koreensis]|uniref:hypothetical protein n=1 Tax=Taibaiella koreensis TaxID=1268548 RepID=UPI000E59D256|nr:hypothetical protein [Taibaiella koreensis]
MTDYTYNGDFNQGMTFSTMVANARLNHGGPQPISEERVNVYVNEGDGIAVPYGEPITRYAAWPLLSCAAVIFASADSLNAYIYHASRGIVPLQTFNTAMATLGNVPLPSVQVIYTFPGASNNGYRESANKIASYGVPAQNIVFAPNLSLQTFGINSATVIG